MTGGPIRIAAAAAMLLLHPHQRGVHGFAPSPPPLSRIPIGHHRHANANADAPRFPATTWTTTTTTTCLRNGNGSGDDEARRLKDKADRLRGEAEKLRLTLGLQKIEKLETEIRALVKSKGDDDGESLDKNHDKDDRLRELKDKVRDLARGSLGTEEAEAMLSKISSFSSDSAGGATSTTNRGDEAVSPLTEDEVRSAIAFLGTLPLPVKDTLAKAAGYPGYDSVVDADELVRNLYANRDKSTEQLRRLYFDSFAKGLPDQPSPESDVQKFVGKIRGTAQTDEEYELLDKLAATIEGRMVDNGTRAMELFPRTVQEMEPELLPTDEDADVVFQALEKSFMATERPDRVQGGYIIRGKNKRKSASELLDYLDGKIARADPGWAEKYQVGFVEIYSDSSEELFEDALLITPNRFPSMAPKLLSVAVTSIALFSSFVFCIDAFGENEVVMQRLKDASEIAQAGGAYDITWFNELLVPLLVTLGAAQGLHEVAHLLVAWTKQVKLTAPTILPSQALPYLSFQNRLKTSPKGYADLFDIAFVGPITGLSVSFIALLVGLQLTTEVDATTAQLLPSLPVGYLTQSTLGGTIVDLVLGGGDGILLNQDAATQVPLHPVAIGGFLGLIIHALDLVPVGSTDGGRMSQAVLGRVWHLTFSSLIFFVLFITSFTSDSNILLGFLFIYSFTQRDMEIPCRNEIDKAELARGVAALVSYLLAALILVPLR